MSSKQLDNLFSVSRNDVKSNENGVRAISAQEILKEDMEIDEYSKGNNISLANSGVHRADDKGSSNIKVEENGQNLGKFVNNEPINNFVPEHFLFSSGGLNIKTESEESKFESDGTGMNKVDGQDLDNNITMENVQALENYMINQTNGAFYKPNNNNNYNNNNEGLNLTDIPKHKLYTRTLCAFGKDDFKCNVCNKTFKDKRDVIRHLRIHTGEKPYECNQCGFRFSCQYNLKRHIETHKGEKPFPCNICNRHFARKEYLDQHILLHSDDSEKPFPCHLCSKGYVKRSYLERHLKTHVRVLEFFCSICGQGFHESRGLVSHMSRLHSGVRPFPCSICKQEFRKEHLLKKHMATHTNFSITSELHSLFGNMTNQNNPEEVKDDKSVYQESNTFENSIDGKVSLLQDRILENVNKVTSMVDLNKNETSSDISEKISNVTEGQNLGNSESDIKMNQEPTLHNKYTPSISESTVENTKNENPLPLYHRLFQSSVLNVDNNKPTIMMSNMVKNKKENKKQGKLETLPGILGVMGKEHFGLHDGASKSTGNGTFENLPKEIQSLLQHSLFQSSVPNIDRNAPTIELSDMVNIKKESLDPETSETLPDHLVIAESEARQLSDNDTSKNVPRETLSLLQQSLLQPSTKNIDKTEDAFNEISEAPHNYLVQSIVEENSDIFTSNEVTALTSKERPYVCSMCKKGFSKKTYLEQHMYTHGDISQRPFQCHLCNNGFTKRSHYERHLKSHSKVLEFFCEICGKGFFEKRGVTRHMQTMHSGIRPFKCSICKQEFKKEHLLEKHMLSHINPDTSMETSESHSLFGSMLSQNMSENVDKDQESQSSLESSQRQHNISGNMSNDKESHDSMEATECHSLFDSIHRQNTILRNMDNNNEIHSSAKAFENHKLYGGIPKQYISGNKKDPQESPLLLEKSGSHSLYDSLPSQNYILGNVNNSKHHHSPDMFKNSKDEEPAVHAISKQILGNKIEQKDSPFVPIAPEIVIYNDDEH